MTSPKPSPFLLAINNIELELTSTTYMQSVAPCSQISELYHFTMDRSGFSFAVSEVYNLINVPHSPH